MFDLRHFQIPLGLSGHNPILSGGKICKNDRWMGVGGKCSGERPGERGEEGGAKWAWSDKDGVRTEYWWQDFR